MYSYSYNIPQNNRNMYKQYGSYTTNTYTNPNDERFVPFVAPLLLGGVAGYAIGQSNNKQAYYYPQPYYYPYQAYYSNNYYYNPYNY